MRVLGGDFPEDKPVVWLRGVFGGIKGVAVSTGLIRAAKYPKDKIVSVEVVTSENATSVAGAGFGIAAGALLAGPVGAIVGGVLGGKGSKQVAAVTFEDGKRALIEGKAKDINMLVAWAWR